MLKLLRRWLLTAVPLVFLVSVFTFVLASLVPGDAARAIVGIDAPVEQYERLRLELGLDKPLPQQYWDWLTGALHGDLGHSIASRDSVAHQISVRLGVTLMLIVGGTTVAALIGVSLGIASALRRGVLGRIVDVISLVGAAVPSYWLGLVMAWVFAVQWRWFPAIGYSAFGDGAVDWLKSLALPVLTLGIAASAPIAKQTRDGVSTQLGMDYVTVLRARGISERSIVSRHVLRNAAVPVVTVLGLMVTGLLSGTVLVETIFVLPGLGGVAVSATNAHDIPLLQGVAVTFTLVVVLVNLLVELVTAWLDPKVRT